MSARVGRSSSESSSELDTSIVSLQSVLSSTATKRIDSEYFRKSFVDDDRRLKERSDLFTTFSELGLTVDASAFYPSIEEHYGTGDLPFLRVADVDDVIDLDGGVTIPEELCQLYPTLATVQPGDLVFTKGGSVARVGYVNTKAAASRDLIFINSSKLKDSESKFLYAYVRTPFFRRMLLRSSSQTTQPHLTITLVRELPVLKLSRVLTDPLGRLIDCAHAAHVEGLRLQREAENVLVRELGLAGWSPPNPLTYTACASDVFQAGRLDAQYYRPRYLEVEARLLSTGNACPLGRALDVVTRGRQPSYSDEGVRVINSKHVRTNRVIDRDCRLAELQMSAPLVEFGDVLLNGTGVGTLGRAAPYLDDQPSIPDNHVTILRGRSLDPIYLSVFLNSMVGQLQIEQHIKGSSGQIELYPSEIERLLVWEAPTQIQRGARDLVLNAAAREKEARSLMELAKEAVELAIELGETAGLHRLSEAGF